MRSAPRACSAPKNGCRWLSMIPGMTAAPSRSTTSACPPARARIPASSPTAAMRPPATAIAVAAGRSGSRVRTRPETRARSIEGVVIVDRQRRTIGPSGDAFVLVGLHRYGFLDMAPADAVRFGAALVRPHPALPLRVAREWASTLGTATRPAPPPGAGRPVLLIPGFLAGDPSVARLSAWLRGG